MAESFEGEEGEAATDFPLSGAWWASVFNLFLAWEDYTREWAGAYWTIWLTCGWEGRDKLGQPRCWKTIGWTISFHLLFLGTWGCNETWGGTGIPGTCGAWKGGLSGLGWTSPFPIQLKNPSWNSFLNSCKYASKCIENLGLIGPLFQFPLPLLPRSWLPLLKKLILVMHYWLATSFFNNHT